MRSTSHWIFTFYFEALVARGNRTADIGGGGWVVPNPSPFFLFLEQGATVSRIGDYVRR